MSSGSDDVGRDAKCSAKRLHAIIVKQANFTVEIGIPLWQGLAIVLAKNRDFLNKGSRLTNIAERAGYLGGGLGL